MIESQNCKIVSITPPAAIVDNAAFTTASVDTKGWDGALVCCYFGAMDIAMAALKLQHSDNDSDYADVTGGDFSTAGTLPSASADNTFVGWAVNLQGKRRYLDVVATGGDGSAGTYMTAFVVLFRGATSPSTAAGRGFGQLLTV